MIKNFKIFETNSKKLRAQPRPKIGDWIVSNLKNINQKYANSNVGRLQKINRGVEFLVYYDGLEKVSTLINVGKWKNLIPLYMWDIEFWSSDKKTCEIYLQTRKYNL